uniref:Copine 7 n=1 Tax=Panthera tigris altaica TaxID=74533 RepID=A0A8C9JA21_PANTA
GALGSQRLISGPPGGRPVACFPVGSCGLQHECRAGGGRPTPIGCLQVDRTEVVQSSLHPVFSKVFTLDYYFEEVQKLRFEVYDTRGPSDLGYQDDDFLGGMECTLGQVGSVPSGGRRAREIPARGKGWPRWAGAGGSPRGGRTGWWRARSHSCSRPLATSTAGTKEIEAPGVQPLSPLQDQALPLPLLQDLFSKSDPFLELYRVNDDGSEQLVYRTEVVKDNLSPVWEPFKVSLNNLCSCEETRPLKCLVWDHDSRGKHDFIGEFSTTFEEMQKAFGEDQAQWDCVNAKYRQRKRNYKNSGVVILADLKVSCGPCPQTPHSPTVAIDFTASNGDPRNSCSLHYINPFQPNEYLQALVAVGEICQDYDNRCFFSSDKRFSALGFGARIPPKYEVSHDFAINFNPEDDECEGIQGVVEAYRNCLPRVQLYGPTNVAPVISKVARMAAAEESTGEASVGTWGSPGLDSADRVPWWHSPHSCRLIPRNRAQTSPEVTGMSPGVTHVCFSPRSEPASPAALAKCVLAEVPRQVVEYFSYRELPPRGLGTHTYDAGP